MSFTRKCFYKEMFFPCVNFVHMMICLFLAPVDGRPRAIVFTAQVKDHYYRRANKT